MCGRLLYGEYRAASIDRVSKKKKKERNTVDLHHSTFIFYFYDFSQRQKSVKKIDRSGDLYRLKKNLSEMVNSFQMTDITCCRPGSCWCSRWHHPTPSRAIVAGPCTVSPATPWKVPRTRGSWSPVSFQHATRVSFNHRRSNFRPAEYLMAASARLKFRVNHRYASTGNASIIALSFSLFLSLIVCFLRNVSRAVGNSWLFMQIE